MSQINPYYIIITKYLLLNNMVNIIILISQNINSIHNIMADKKFIQQIFICLNKSLFSTKSAVFHSSNKCYLDIEKQTIFYFFLICRITSVISSYLMNTFLFEKQGLSV